MNDSKKGSSYILYLYKAEHPEDVFEHVACLELDDMSLKANSNELKGMIADQHYCSPYDIELHKSFDSLSSLNSFLNKKGLEDLPVYKLTPEMALMNTSLN